MGITTQVIGLILSLSLLVIVHEFGHYFFARLFKTRVDKYYIFFNPYLSPTSSSTTAKGRCSG